MESYLEQNGIDKLKENLLKYFNNVIILKLKIDMKLK